MPQLFIAGIDLVSPPNNLTPGQIERHFSLNPRRTYGVLPRAVALALRQPLLTNGFDIDIDIEVVKGSGRDGYTFRQSDPVESATGRV